MNREEMLARERATKNIEHQRREEYAAKIKRDAETAAKNERALKPLEDKADQIRDQTRAKKGWPEHEKVKPLVVKAIKRLDKAIVELSDALVDVNKQFHALYHTAPKTDGTPYTLSPMAPSRVMQWFRQGLFKVEPVTFRWITRTWLSPVEVRSFAEEALPAVEWCTRFKVDDKKPNISHETEEIF